MVQLYVIVWMMAALFAYVGFQRGWSKEVISMSGIILGLFALNQFDVLIRETLFGQLDDVQTFYGQIIIFLTIVFFSYQTRAIISRSDRDGDGRDSLQSSVLGAIVGFVNGYLIFGSIWYFLDINRNVVTNDYPLAPYIVAPQAGSVGADAIANLPLYVLAQPGTNGDLLSFAVVVLFIVVLVVI